MVEIIGDKKDIKVTYEDNNNHQSGIEPWKLCQEPNLPVTDSKILDLVNNQTRRYYYGIEQIKTECDNSKCNDCYVTLEELKNFTKGSKKIWTDNEYKELLAEMNTLNINFKLDSDTCNTKNDMLNSYGTTMHLYTYLSALINSSTDIGLSDNMLPKTTFLEEIIDVAPLKDCNIAKTANRKDSLQVLMRLAKESTKSSSKVFQGIIPTNLEMINADGSSAQRGICFSQSHKDSLQPGTTIYTFTPLLCTVQDTPLVDSQVKEEYATTHICYNCHMSIEPGIKSLCENCGIARYCSYACMNMHKNFHELECEYMKFPLLPFSGTTIERMVLNLISLLVNQDDDTLLRQVASLTSHYDYVVDCISGSYEKTVFDQKKVINYSLTILSRLDLLITTRLNSNSKNLFFFGISEALLKLILIIIVNSTVLQDNYENDIGLMFDPFFALINHSCEPNCTLVFENNKVYLKALNAIKPGEELFVNYCSIVYPRAIRKSNLSSYFFFDCNCNLCSGPYDKWFPIVCPDFHAQIGGFDLRDHLMGFKSSIDSSRYTIVCPKCQNNEAIYKDNYTTYSLMIKCIRNVYSPGIKNSDLSEIFQDLNIPQTTLNFGERRKFEFLLDGIISDWKTIPLYAWPIVKMAGTLANSYRDEIESNPSLEKYLKFFKYSSLEFVGIEMMNTSEFNISLGIKLHQFLVMYVGFMQIVLQIPTSSMLKLGNREIDNSTKITLAYAGLVLCIQGYKYISVKHEGNYIEPLEDFMNYSNVIVFLLMSNKLICDLPALNNKESRECLQEMYAILGISHLIGPYQCYDSCYFDRFQSITTTDTDLFGFIMKKT